MGVDFSLLRPVDMAGAMNAGIDRGMKLRQQVDTRNALQAFVQNPDDPMAQRQAMLMDPQATSNMMKMRRQQGEWSREDEFRGAYGDYVAASQPGVLNGRPAIPARPGALSGGAPVPASAPATNALTGLMPPPRDDVDAYMPGLPGAPVGAGTSALAAPASPAPQAMPGATQPAAGGDQPAADYKQAVDQQSAAFARMAKADPAKAADAQKQFYANAKSRLDLMDAVYSEAYEELAGVSDEAGYQRILEHVSQQFSPYGVDIRTVVPPTFPGEKGIRELRMRALDAKDQIVAADRYMKFQWDVEDDVADNERADRNADSLIGDRSARRGLAERREQRVASTPRGGRSGGGNRPPTASGVTGAVLQKYRGGETLTPNEQTIFDRYMNGTPRGNRGSRGGASASTVGLPKANSKADYDRLKPGTEYIAPDGSRKRKAG